MKTVIIQEGTNHKGQRFKAIAFYGVEDRFMYTKTYIYDEDGYVDKSVTVFSDGTVSEQ